METDQTDLIEHQHYKIILVFTTLHIHKSIERTNRIGRIGLQSQLHLPAGVNPLSRCDYRIVFQPDIKGSIGLYRIAAAYKTGIETPKECITGINTGISRHGEQQLVS